MKRVTTLLATLAVTLGLAALTTPAANAATETCQAYVNKQIVHPTFFGSEDQSILLNLQYAVCTLGDGHFYKRWRIAVRQDNKLDVRDIAVGLKTTRPEFGEQGCGAPDMTIGVWHVPPADSNTWVSPSFRFSLTDNGPFVFADMHVQYFDGDSFGNTDCWHWV